MYYVHARKLMYQISQGNIKVKYLERGKRKKKRIKTFYLRILWKVRMYVRRRNKRNQHKNNKKEAFKNEKYTNKKYTC